MSVIIKSGNSGNLATVNSNGEVTIAPTQTIENSGYIAMASMNDDGTTYGTPYLLPPETSRDYRLRTGIDTMLMNEVFNGTAQYTHTWFHSFTTMTMTMSGGSILMNAGSATVASNYAAHSSRRTFPLIATAPLYVEFLCTPINAALANQIVEFGLFTNPGLSSAPGDGVYFRYSSAGLVGCINFNTSEVESGVLAASLVSNTATKLLMVIGRKTVEFWKDDVLLTIMDVPAGNGQVFLTTALPVCFQFRNSGTVTGSPVMQFKIFNVNVSLGDVNTAKPWSHQMAGFGQMAYQGQNNGTMGTTALYSNSLAAGAGAAMTNTTAALGSGLGGQFTTQPTLAAGTDGIVCSYQNPAATVNTTPRNLIITGIRVQGAVTAALTGGPVLYAYSLAFGHTAASMATSEGATFTNTTTKAARRIALGFETFPVTAAAGVVGAGVYIQFGSPVVVSSNEFVAVVAKNLGTVTSGGTITFLVTFDAYFE